jgi:hypothetical protein
MKYLATILLIVPFLHSCTKDPSEISSQAREKIAGTYDVLRVDITTYDSLGNILTTASYDYPGVIDFTLNSTGIQNENRISFPDDFFNYTNAFGKLKTSKFCYWDTDPEFLRLIIWGLDQGGNSIHTTLSQTLTQGLSLTYIETNDAVLPQSNTMARKEFYLLKKR